MKYLPKHRDDIEKALGESEVMLFLDYDGTLTPIADKPQKAVIPQRTRSLLRRLVKEDACTVAVVSGRSLADIKRIVGVRGIIYAGNHGLQLQGPKIRFNKVVSVSYRKILRGIKRTLDSKLEGFKGAFLEDKGQVLTLHYRLLRRSKVPALKTLLHEAVVRFIAQGQVRLNKGKKVIEIKPAVDWDKGKLVLWLLARKKFAGAKKLLPIYIGDDITDEDAFKALRSRGVTVFVGKPGKSSAEYFLKSCLEVQSFIELISHITCPKNKKN